MERRPDKDPKKEEQQHREHGRTDREQRPMDEQFPGQHQERQPGRQFGETQREPGRQQDQPGKRDDGARKFGERREQPAGGRRDQRS